MKNCSHVGRFNSPKLWCLSALQSLVWDFHFPDQNSYSRLLFFFIRKTIAFPETPFKRPLFHVTDSLGTCNIPTTNKINICYQGRGGEWILVGNLGAGSEQVQSLWPLPRNAHCLRQLPRASPSHPLLFKMYWAKPQCEAASVGEPLDHQHYWLNTYSHGPRERLVISSGSDVSEKWPLWED